MKYALLGFCVIGTIAPYSALGPWLFTNGADVGLFLRQLFENHISTAFALDVLVSAMVVLMLAVRDRDLRKTNRFAICGATLLVGVSAGLPLYLYLKMRAKGFGTI